MANRKPRLVEPTMRDRVTATHVLDGLSVPDAMRKAGYSESYVRAFAGKKAKSEALAMAMLEQERNIKPGTLRGMGKAIVFSKLTMDRPKDERACLGWTRTALEIDGGLGPSVEVNMLQQNYFENGNPFARMSEPSRKLMAGSMAFTLMEQNPGMSLRRIVAMTEQELNRNANYKAIISCCFPSESWASSGRWYGTCSWTAIRLRIAWSNRRHSILQSAATPKPSSTASNAATATAAANASRKRTIRNRPARSTSSANTAGNPSSPSARGLFQSRPWSIFKHPSAIEP